MYYHSITFIPHYRKISSQRFFLVQIYRFFYKTKHAMRKNHKSDNWVTNRPTKWKDDWAICEQIVKSKGDMGCVGERRKGAENKPFIWNNLCFAGLWNLLVIRLGSLRSRGDVVIKFVLVYELSYLRNLLITISPGIEETSPGIEETSSGIEKTSPRLVKTNPGLGKKKLSI